MAQDTKIEWCDHTVNFWWGCSKVSPACANCYAERQDAHFHPEVRNPRPNPVSLAEHWGPDAPRLLRVDAGRREALRYERRAVAEGRRFRGFTNSMSDFFEDRRDLDSARLQALDVIRQTPHLDWLCLTKRPERIMDLLKLAWEEADPDLSVWLHAWASGDPPANVWLGATVEDQQRADQRIPALLQVPAAVRFLSCEPLLGPVRLDQCAPYILGGDDSNPGVMNAFNGMCHHPATVRTMPKVEGTAEGVQWVIVGGESGPHARPMHPDWARGLRDQCAAAGVPFLFKQWGSLEPMGTTDGRQILPFGTYLLPGTPGAPSGGFGFIHSRGKGHRLLDGVEHNGYPEVGRG